MISISFLLPRPRKLYNIVNILHRPPRTDESEVRRVLSAYDLGQLKGYRQPAIGPSRSRNLILDISSGRKVLKRYKPSMSFEGIIYEHSVLKHLTANDFPSARLVPSKKGETCLKVEGIHYALFDFIPGFRYTDYFISAGRKKNFLAEAGKTLARYHQIMDGFVPDGRKLDGFTPDGRQRWLDPSWYLTRFAKYETLFKEKGEKSELEQFFVDNLDRLKQCYVDLNQRVEEKSSQLPKVVNHGDYGPHNLLFNQRGLTAVLDFECVHLNLRVAEMMAALQFFAGQGMIGFDYDKARVFFEAYSLSCPLMIGEIKLMPDVLRLALLEGLVYYFRDYFNSGNLLKLHYARRSAAWVDWLEKNGDSLVEVFLSFGSRDVR